MSISRVKTLFRLQRTILVLLFVSFLCGMILGISLVTNTDLGSGILSLFSAEKQGPLDHNKNNKPVINQEGLEKNFPSRWSKHRQSINESVNMSHGKHDGNFASNFPENKAKSKKNGGAIKQNEDLKLHQGGVTGLMEKFPAPNYNVHIFYYPWYGNPEHDGGKWLHWNHEYLPHWNKEEAKKWPSSRHVPPDDIGSNFYPELGPYSSKDPKVMLEHMKQIRSSGIGVLAVSWYPPDDADQQGQPWDAFLPQLMDAADQFKLKVCLHIEPYKNRSATVFRKHLKYLTNRYGSHPAFFRYNLRGKDLPMYYIYDSYLVKAADWAKIFRKDGLASVRGTELDGVFIGLAVEETHGSELVSAGFDGFFTYFASDGFTYGSSTRNWDRLSSFAFTNNMLFIPSVGPGYNDERVRPWNGRNTKDREHGGYFEQSFKAAINSRPPLISVTSFNEWHEGTQIEKAVPKHVPGFDYADYSPQSSSYYLMLTRKWVHKFKRYQGNQNN